MSIKHRAPSSLALFLFVFVVDYRYMHVHVNTYGNEQLHKKIRNI